MPPVRQPVVLIHTVRAPDHDTLVPIELVNLAVNSKEDVRKCFFIENFPAAVFSFHIGWDALGPGFMVAVDTEEFNRNGAGILFCAGVAVIQVIIETRITKDDYGIGFCCFHCAAKGVHAEKVPMCVTCEIGCHSIQLHSIMNFDTVYRWAWDTHPRK